MKQPSSDSSFDEKQPQDVTEEELPSSRCTLISDEPIKPKSNRTSNIPIFEQENVRAPAFDKKSISSANQNGATAV